MYGATELHETEFGIINGAANEPKIDISFRNRLLWTAGKSEKGAVLFLRHGPLIVRE